MIEEKDMETYDEYIENDDEILKSNKKIIIIAIIVVVLVIAGIFIGTKIFKLHRYKECMDLGQKYLTQENFKGATQEFEKAIKIDSKSQEAKIEAAKAYINLGNVDNAIEQLRKAFYLDIKNEELLKKIIEVLNTKYPVEAYNLLNEFIGDIGIDNVSLNIRGLIKKSNEDVNKFVIEPKSGTFENPISVKINSGNMRVGHSYYYTINGTDPSKNSNRYIEEIKITKSTELNIIGYNQNGESSEVVTLKYKIKEDEEISSDKIRKNQLVDKSKLKEVLSQANKIYHDAQSGKSEVKYGDDAILKLKKAIDKAQKVYDSEQVTENEVYVLTVYLKSGIETFKNSNIN